MDPNPFRRRQSISEQYAQAGKQLADAFVRGLTEEPTGTPEEQAKEMAEMFAFAEAATMRTFGVLYDDE